MTHKIASPGGARFPEKPKWSSGPPGDGQPPAFRIRSHGKLSRGPVTPEGKAISSKNAVKHDLLINSALLPGEDRKEFRKVLAREIIEHEPETPAEHQLVQKLALFQWRQMRAGPCSTAGTPARSQSPRTPGLAPRTPGSRSPRTPGSRPPERPVLARRIKRREQAPAFMGATRHSANPLTFICRARFLGPGRFRKAKIKSGRQLAETSERAVSSGSRRRVSPGGNF